MARLLSILTVCGCGFGSSLILRMGVEDVLSEEGLEAKVEAWDTGTAKCQKVDIIACSQDIVPQLEGFEGAIVPVRDITSKEEIRKKLMPVFKKIFDEINAKKT